MEFGYERVPVISQTGEFSVRGFIVDVYSTDENPVRLEYFGDTIESIRVFNVIDQISFKELENYEITFIKEIKQKKYLIEQLPDDTVIFIDEEQAVKLHAMEFLPVEYREYFEEFERLLSEKKIIKVTSNISHSVKNWNAGIVPVSSFNGDIEKFASGIKNNKKDELLTIIYTFQDRRLFEIFSGYNVS